MKIEIVRKVMVVGIALLIGGAVCVSVWLFLREHKGRELQGQNNKIAAYNQAPLQTSQKSTGNLDEEPLTIRERIKQQTKSNFMSSLSEEELADPIVQKMLEAINSPEYLDLMETDYNIRQWNDFMESQGVPVTREHPGLFRKVAPHIEFENYEPVIRRKLAELFIAAEPVDLTDPVAADQQRRDVYFELISSDSDMGNFELTSSNMVNMAWLVEKFGEDRDGLFRSKNRSKDIEGNPAFIWMSDVQRNAASIVAAAEAAGGDAPETQTGAPSWDMSSVMESPSASDSETEMPTTPDTSASVPMTDTEIETAIEKSLTSQPPNILTNQRPNTPGEIPSDLEASLKVQFSSERFERAMDTLEQYGSEEGVRRLRENDPEIAKRIEQHRNREEDSQ